MEMLGLDAHRPLRPTRSAFSRNNPIAMTKPGREQHTQPGHRGASPPGDETLSSLRAPPSTRVACGPTGVIAE
jgi:hypothetical protein